MIFSFQWHVLFRSCPFCTGLCSLELLLIQNSVPVRVVREEKKKTLTIKTPMFCCQGNAKTLFQFWNNKWISSLSVVSGRSSPNCSRMIWQYLWISLVAQWVKNPLTRQETQVDTGSIPRLGRSAGKGNGYPFQYSCLENPMDRGAWWATVHNVTKSRTQLKWLSMHTCMLISSDLLIWCTSPAPQQYVARSHCMSVFQLPLVDKNPSPLPQDKDLKLSTMPFIRHTTRAF